jgi:hypothetical protein
MTSDRENLGAGIYVALTTLLVLVCLVGAFVLPPSFFAARWLAVFALFGFFIGVPVLLLLAHRSRIREAVGKLGGTVIRIKKLPFWKQSFANKYGFFLGVQFTVEYVDLRGTAHRALCNSGFFQGVEWLADAVVEGR